MQGGKSRQINSGKGERNVCVWLRDVHFCSLRQYLQGGGKKKKLMWLKFWKYDRAGWKWKTPCWGWDYQRAALATNTSIKYKWAWTESILYTPIDRNDLVTRSKDNGSWHTGTQAKRGLRKGAFFSRAETKSAWAGAMKPYLISVPPVSLLWQRGAFW